MMAEGGSYVHDFGLLLFYYVFQVRTASPLQSFGVAYTRLTSKACRQGGLAVVTRYPHHERRTPLQTGW